MAPVFGGFSFFIFFHLETIMDYLIIALIIVAVAIVVGFFVFTRRDEIAETITDTVDDIATGAADAVAHAADELKEEAEKLTRD